MTPKKRGASTGIETPHRQARELPRTREDGRTPISGRRVAHDSTDATAFRRVPALQVARDTLLMLAVLVAASAAVLGAGHLATIAPVLAASAGLAVIVMLFAVLLWEVWR